MNLAAKSVSEPLDRHEMVTLLTEQYLDCFRQNDNDGMLDAFIRMKHMAIHKHIDRLYYEELP
jgi:hypothetical protein